MKAFADKTNEVCREGGKGLVERQGRSSGIVGFRVINSRRCIKSGFFGRIVLRERRLVGECLPCRSVTTLFGKRIERFTGGGKTQTVALASLLES